MSHRRRAIYIIAAGIAIAIFFIALGTKTTTTYAIDAADVQCPAEDTTDTYSCGYPSSIPTASGEKRCLLNKPCMQTEPDCGLVKGICKSEGKCQAITACGKATDKPLVPATNPTSSTAPPSTATAPAAATAPASTASPSPAPIPYALANSGLPPAPTPSAINSPNWTGLQNQGLSGNPNSSLDDGLSLNKSVLQDIQSISPNNNGYEPSGSLQPSGGLGSPSAPVAPESGSGGPGTGVGSGVSGFGQSSTVINPTTGLPETPVASTPSPSVWSTIGNAITSGVSNVEAAISQAFASPPNQGPELVGSETTGTQAGEANAIDAANKLAGLNTQIVDGAGTIGALNLNAPPSVSNGTDYTVSPGHFTPTGGLTYQFPNGGGFTSDTDQYLSDHYGLTNQTSPTTGLTVTPTQQFLSGYSQEVGAYNQFVSDPKNVDLAMYGQAIEANNAQIPAAQSQIASDRALNAAAPTLVDANGVPFTQTDINKQNNAIAQAQGMNQILGNAAECLSVGCSASIDSEAKAIADPTGSAAEKWLITQNLSNEMGTIMTAPQTVTASQTAEPYVPPTTALQGYTDASTANDAKAAAFDANAKAFADNINNGTPLSPLNQQSVDAYNEKLTGFSAAATSISYWASGGPLSGMAEYMDPVERGAVSMTLGAPASAFNAAVEAFNGPTTATQLEAAGAETPGQITVDRVVAGVQTGLNTLTIGSLASPAVGRVLSDGFSILGNDIAPNVLNDARAGLATDLGIVPESGVAPGPLQITSTATGVSFPSEPITLDAALDSNGTYNIIGTEASGASTPAGGYTPSGPVVDGLNPAEAVTQSTPPTTVESTPAPPTQTGGYSPSGPIAGGLNPTETLAPPVEQAAPPTAPTTPVVGYTPSGPIVDGLNPTAALAPPVEATPVVAPTQNVTGGYLAAGPTSLPEGTVADFYAEPSTEPSAPSVESISGGGSAQYPTLPATQPQGTVADFYTEPSEAAPAASGQSASGMSAGGYSPSGPTSLPQPTLADFYQEPALPELAAEPTQTPTTQSGGYLAAGPTPEGLTPNPTTAPAPAVSPEPAPAPASPQYVAASTPLPTTNPVPGSNLTSAEATAIERYSSALLDSQVPVPAEISSDVVAQVQASLTAQVAEAKAGLADAGLTVTSDNAQIVRSDTGDVVAVRSTIDNGITTYNLPLTVEPGALSAAPSPAPYTSAADTYELPSGGTVSPDAFTLDQQIARGINDVTFSNGIAASVPYDQAAAVNNLGYSLAAQSAPLPAGASADYAAAMSLRNTDLVTAALDNLDSVGLSIRLDGAVVNADNQVVAALNPVSVPGASPYSLAAPVESPAPVASTPASSGSMAAPSPSPSSASLAPTQLETLVADRDPFTLAPLKMEITPEDLSATAEAPSRAPATEPATIAPGTITAPQLDAIDAYNATLAAASEPLPANLSTADAVNTVKVNNSYVASALNYLGAVGLTINPNGSIQNASTGDVVAVKGPVNVPGTAPYVVVASSPTVAPRTSAPAPSVAPTPPIATNSNMPPTRSPASNPISNIIKATSIAASFLFGAPITSAVPDLANSINTNLGSGIASLLNQSAQANPLITTSVSPVSSPTPAPTAAAPVNVNPLITQMRANLAILADNSTSGQAVHDATVALKGVVMQLQQIAQTSGKTAYLTQEFPQSLAGYAKELDSLIANPFATKTTKGIAGAPDDSYTMRHVAVVVGSVLAHSSATNLPNSEPTPVPAVAPVPVTDINLVATQAAVAASAYAKVIAQGISSDDMVLIGPTYVGNAKYANAWRDTIQATIQELASQGILNPQLDVSTMVALARREQVVPGALNISGTGVQGLMQVTGGTAFEILGSAGFTTSLGIINAADFARGNNIGSVITGTIYINQLLNKYGGNLTAAAQSYNSGSPNSCVGGDCSYGSKAATDATVMRNAIAAGKGDVAATAQNLTGLTNDGRLTTPAALNDIASILVGSSVARAPLQKSDVTIVGDSTGQGTSGCASDVGTACAGTTFPGNAVTGGRIATEAKPGQDVLDQINALPDGSKVAVMAGTNDFGESESDIQTAVKSVLAVAAKKNITIVAWAGPSKDLTGLKDPNGKLLDPQFAAADNAIKSALPSSIPFVDLRSPSLDQYRVGYHYTSAGYTAIGNMIMAAANAGNTSPVVVTKLNVPPPPGGWQGTPGKPTILPGNPGRIPGITVINLSEVAGATTPVTTAPAVTAPTASEDQAGSPATVPGGITQSMVNTAQSNLKAAETGLNVMKGLWWWPTEAQKLEISNGTKAAESLVTNLNDLGNQNLSQQLNGYVSLIHSMSLPENQTSANQTKVGQLGTSLVVQAHAFLDNLKPTPAPAPTPTPTPPSTPATKLPPNTITAVDKQTGMAYSCDTGATADCQTAFRKEIALERGIEAGTLPKNATFVTYKAVPSSISTSPNASATGAPASSPSSQAIPSDLTETTGSAVAPGQVFYELPAGFDPTKPATIVYYLHGDNGSISDAVNRQGVLQQLRTSGCNCALVIPEFATSKQTGHVDTGSLATADGFKNFVTETDQKLAALVPTANPTSFQSMPITVIGYSGGYLPMTAAVEGLGSKINVVEDLDGAYSSVVSPIQAWLTNNPSAMFVSECSVTCDGNTALSAALQKAGITVNTNPTALVARASIITVGGDHATFVSDGSPIEKLLQADAPHMPPTPIATRSLPASAATPDLSIVSRSVFGYGAYITAKDANLSSNAPSIGSLQTFKAVPTGSAAVPMTDAQAQKVVDDYLFGIYEITPKADSTGDFTSKDPAAAAHMDKNLESYVIDGMSPNFRLNLYYALQAMEASGINVGITSAYRDSYRQSLITEGVRAAAGASQHEGACPYGCGSAADLVGINGTSNQVVWNWIDANGQQYGIARPISSFDPPHVAPTSGPEFKRIEGTPSVPYDTALASEQAKFASMTTTATIGTYNLVDPKTGAIDATNVTIPSSSIRPDGTVIVATVGMQPVTGSTAPVPSVATAPVAPTTHVVASAPPTQVVTTDNNQTLPGAPWLSWLAALLGTRSSIKTYTDPQTGKLYMTSKPNTYPVLYASDGTAIQTSGSLDGTWTGALNSIINTPDKFTQFESAYLDGGKPDGSSLVYISGVGDKLFGTDTLANELRSKYNINVSLQYQTSILEPNSLPASSAQRAQMVAMVAQEAAKYPASFWQKTPNITLEISQSSDSAAGSAAVRNGQSLIWLTPPTNGATITFLQGAFNHELAHIIDFSGILPSDQEWGTTVYGPNYAQMYRDQYRNGFFHTLFSLLPRPSGFTCDYGCTYATEDKATIIEAMFVNYPEVMSIAQNDPILAKKVAMVKDAFFDASDGDMNDAYWQNLTTIIPNATEQQLESDLAATQAADDTNVTPTAATVPIPASTSAPAPASTPVTLLAAPQTTLTSFGKKAISLADGEALALQIAASSPEVHALLVLERNELDIKGFDALAAAIGKSLEQNLGIQIHYVTDAAGLSFNDPVPVDNGVTIPAETLDVYDQNTNTLYVRFGNPDLNTLGDSVFDAYAQKIFGDAVVVDISTPTLEQYSPFNWMWDHASRYAGQPSDTVASAAANILNKAGFSLQASEAAVSSVPSPIATLTAAESAAISTFNRLLAAAPSLTPDESVLSATGLEIDSDGKIVRTATGEIVANPVFDSQGDVVSYEPNAASAPVSTPAPQATPGPIILPAAPAAGGNGGGIVPPTGGSGGGSVGGGTPPGGSAGGSSYVRPTIGFGILGGLAWLWNSLFPSNTQGKGNTIPNPASASGPTPTSTAAPTAPPASTAPAATPPPAAPQPACYDLLDSSGATVAKCVVLPAGSIKPDGTVDIASTDGKPILDANNKPVLIASDATLPKGTQDLTNPNNTTFADTRPAAPAPTPPPPLTGPKTTNPGGGSQQQQQIYSTPGLGSGQSTPSPLPQPALSPLGTPQLSCSPSTIVASSSVPVTIRWSCLSGTPVSSGFATGGASWGQVSVPVPQNAPSVMRFSLSCLTGYQYQQSQPAMCSVSIQQPPVKQAPPVPVVGLVANPKSVKKGGTTHLSWTSLNTTTCTLVGPGGIQVGGQATSSTVISPALSTTTPFVATCTGIAGGSAAATTTVTVQ